MQGPLGHIPGFHIPGTTIPIAAVANGLSIAWPQLSPADLERKKAYRPAMEAYATSLRKRIRHLADRLALGSVRPTPRARPVRQVKQFMRGYKTEYEQLEPAWPVTTIHYGGRGTTVFGRGERLLGVTTSGNVVPMQLVGHWFERRYISESADRNFNRDVIDMVTPNRESVAIEIIRVLEALASDTGISIDAWEPVDRPDSYPYAWNAGSPEPDWVLREE